MVNLTNIFNNSTRKALNPMSTLMETFLSRQIEERFTEGEETEEELRLRVCSYLIGAHVVYTLVIFIALYLSNSYGQIPDALFYGLSCLLLVMPDIVVIILIIVLVLNDSSGSEQIRAVDVAEILPVNTDSSDGKETNKFVLTTTPDVFNN
jgi:hypothetical protein